MTALREMSGDKAPGPDGFMMAFFKHCWEVVKGDVMAMFGQFHSRGTFEPSFNSSFIALIPKKSGAVDIRDFGPISLVGSIYKLLAKRIFGLVEVYGF